MQLVYYLVQNFFIINREKCLDYFSSISQKSLWFVELKSHIYFPTDLLHVFLWNLCPSQKLYLNYKKMKRKKKRKKSTIWVLINPFDPSLLSKHSQHSYPKWVLDFGLSALPNGGWRFVCLCFPPSKDSGQENSSPKVKVDENYNQNDGPLFHLPRMHPKSYVFFQMKP